MWDANTSAFAAAVAQITTAVVAFAAAVFAWRQVTEARRTREAQAQPFVIVDVVPGRVWMNWLTLVVENIGTTLAKDVIITFDPPLTTTDKDNHLAKSTLLCDGIAVLPPGRRVETLFDLSHERLDQKLPMRYEVTVSFRDYRDRPQESLPYAIDLTYLYDLEPIGEKTIHNLVEEVRDMGAELKKWRVGEGLLVRQPSDLRRSSNEAAWQLALTGTHPSLAHPGVAPGFAWPARITLIREPWLSWRRRRVIRAQGRAHEAKK